MVKVSFFSIPLIIILILVSMIFLLNFDLTDQSEERHRFIVVLRENLSLHVHFDGFLNDFLREQSNVDLVHVYDIGLFQGYAIDLNSSGLSALSSCTDVAHVEVDMPCSVSATQLNATWNLARISQRTVPVNNSYYFNDSAGKGVDIYVLDTGIRVTHDEFDGRALFGAKFTDDPSETDDNGHGTHVAGIAVGETFGVAKKARAIAVKVLDSSGRGLWSNVIAGIDWVYQRSSQGNSTAIINLSMSGSYSNALNAAIESVVKAGIHVVTAAGNSASDACLASPASAKSAITVASSSQSDQSSWFTNNGKCVDIYAPGEFILSAYALSDVSSAFMSGTSMSSPIVAGVKALLCSATNASLTDIDGMLLRLATPNTLGSVPSGTSNLLAFNGEESNLNGTFLHLSEGLFISQKQH